jgi:hypothetical protein
VAFLADCSLLTLALPLSAFAYALVSFKPSSLYWQVTPGKPPPLLAFAADGRVSLNLNLTCGLVVEGYPLAVAAGGTGVLRGHHSDAVRFYGARAAALQLHLAPSRTHVSSGPAKQCAMVVVGPLNDV